MIVLTADQRRSRTSPDRVPAALATLITAGLRPTLAFERTIGDEIQGALGSSADAVAAIVALTRLGGWSIGVGVGTVELPLPRSTRELRGAAPIAARAAVEHARRRREPKLSVRGGDAAGCAAVEAILRLYAALLDTRSGPAWQAIDLLRAGSTQSRAGVTLGITRQAVGQRLDAARCDVDEEALRVIILMLEAADPGSAGAGSDGRSLAGGASTAAPAELTRSRA